MPDDNNTGVEGAEGAAGTVLTDPPAGTPKPGEGGEGIPPVDPPKGNEGEGADAAKPKEPEPFELAAPDGYPINEAGLKGLNDLCKSANLTKEQGEAILQHMAGNYSAFQEQQQAQGKAWIEEFKADKDFGGDKFDASVADAKKALATFDEGGAVGKMLQETGYGNNPDVLKFAARAGKALGEDKLPGNGNGGAEDKPLEERMYASWTPKS